MENKLRTQSLSLCYLKVLQTVSVLMENVGRKSLSLWNTKICTKFLLLWNRKLCRSTCLHGTWRGVKQTSSNRSSRAECCSWHSVT